MNDSKCCAREQGGNSNIQEVFCSTGSAAERYREIEAKEGGKSRLNTQLICAEGQSMIYSLAHLNMKAAIGSKMKGTMNIVKATSEGVLILTSPFLVILGLLLAIDAISGLVALMFFLFLLIVSAAGSFLLVLTLKEISRIDDIQNEKFGEHIE